MWTLAQDITGLLLASPPPPTVAVVSFYREDVESVASLRLMSPGAASDGVTLFNFFPKKSDNLFLSLPFCELMTS